MKYLLQRRVNRGHGFVSYQYISNQLTFFNFRRAKKAMKNAQKKDTNKDAKWEIKEIQESEKADWLEVKMIDS